MKALKLKCLVVVLSLLAVATQASAGSRQTQAPALSIEEVAALARKVTKVASEHRARVFLMARQGRPASELPEGIQYTHVSFAVYSVIETEDGRTVPGYAMYNLYQDSGSPDRSSLVVDFPVNFLSGAQEGKVGIVIPRRDLQRRLYDLILSESYHALHNPNYSAISNPYTNQYQNCTEHALDVINAAIYGTKDVTQLKTNAKAYFVAQEIKVNRFKLLLGSMVSPDIKSGDHRGPVKTATYGTIVKYLEANGLADAILTIRI